MGVGWGRISCDFQEMSGNSQEKKRFHEIPLLDYQNLSFLGNLIFPVKRV